MRVAGARQSAAGVVVGDGLDLPRFEEQWPALATRLAAVLARRGVPAARREDLVQETGLRLLRVWDKVDHARGAWPLAATIARNLHRDEARRARPRYVDQVPDTPDLLDVERAGLARLELELVHEALQTLTPAQRRALLAEVAGGERASKQQRLRARKALRTAIDRALLGAGVALARLRRAGVSLETHLGERAALGAEAAGALAVAAAVLFAGPATVERLAGARPAQHGAPELAGTTRRTEEPGAGMRRALASPRQPPKHAPRALAARAGSGGELPLPLPAGDPPEGVLPPEEAGENTSELRRQVRDLLQEVSKLLDRDG